jgi:hypothetical protein
MLTAVYHMLKDGTHHQDLGANHFDRRSPEIKAKRLSAQMAKLGFQVAIAFRVLACVSYRPPAWVTSNHKITAAPIADHPLDGKLQPHMLRFCLTVVKAMRL